MSNRSFLVCIKCLFFHLLQWILIKAFKGYTIMVLIRNNKIERGRHSVRFKLGHTTGQSSESKYAIGKKLWFTRFKGFFFVCSRYYVTLVPFWEWIPLCTMAMLRTMCTMAMLSIIICITWKIVRHILTSKLEPVFSHAKIKSILVCIWCTYAL